MLPRSGQRFRSTRCMTRHAQTCQHSGSAFACWRTQQDSNLWPSPSELGATCFRSMSQCSVACKNPCKSTNPLPRSVRRGLIISLAVPTWCPPKTSEKPMPNKRVSETQLTKPAVDAAMPRANAMKYGIPSSAASDCVSKPRDESSSSFAIAPKAEAAARLRD